MKYSSRILVNLPREEVFQKLEDPSNFKYWQRDLVSCKLLSNRKDQAGVRSKLMYKIGNRKITMVETITKHVFPKKLHLTYEAKGVINIQKNYFEEEPDRSTLWITDCELQFSGALKFFGNFMAGSLMKKTRQYMKDFKVFAEEGNEIETD